MRWLTTITMLLVGLTSSDSHAQKVIRVKNPYPDKTVIMRYLPADSVSKYWENWSWEEIGPGRSKDVMLNQKGPFRVVCFLKDGSSSQAEVSDETVDLQALADPPAVYTLDATFHENRQGREVQVMSARLEDPKTQNQYRLTVAANDTDSELVDQVLRARWRSNFQAVMGPDVNGVLDFNREAKKGGPNFHANQGLDRQLKELLAYEDAAGCHIVGRWVRSDERLKGSVHFFVGKDNTSVLTGTYKVDGRNQEYSWTGQEIIE